MSAAKKSCALSFLVIIEPATVGNRANFTCQLSDRFPIF